MNVAYLDPPYSRYFHALANRLLARNGGRCVALLSSPAYRLYTKGDRARVWQPDRTGTADGIEQFPPEFERAGWARLEDEHFRAAMASAVQWFRQRFVEERIELCLVFSDARPFSVAARLAAQELGVVCLYFERGAFRSRTASLSALGLNARFSLRRAGAAAAITGMPAGELPQLRPTEGWLRLRFLHFLLRHALDCLADPARQQMQHKRYAISPYLRLLMAQWWSRHPRDHDGADGPPADAPLVIVPLQLETDSQLVLHSPFAGNQAFLDFVAAEVRRLMPQARVLAKRHPMDAGHYRLPDGVQWVGGHLARFFDADPLVVCVNSTVGFEAAVQGVRVVCFGASFYADATHLICTTRPRFAGALTQMLQRSADPAAGEALRAAVLRWYQAPGDVWAFTDADIARTAEIVMQHHGAARQMRDARALSPPSSFTAVSAVGATV